LITIQYNDDDDNANDDVDDDNDDADDDDKISRFRKESLLA